MVRERESPEDDVAPNNQLGTDGWLLAERDRGIARCLRLLSQAALPVRPSAPPASIRAIATMATPDTQERQSGNTHQQVIAQKDAEIERLRKKLADIAAWLKRMTEANERLAVDCQIKALRETYLRDAKQCRAMAADIKIVLSETDSHNLVHLSKLEIFLLTKCNSGEDITLLDHANDTARSRRKHLGYLAFDRKSYTWQITEIGKAALTKASQQQPQPHNVRGLE